MEKVFHLPLGLGMLVEPREFGKQGEYDKEGWDVVQVEVLAMRNDVGTVLELASPDLDQDQGEEVHRCMDLLFHPPTH